MTNDIQLFLFGMLVAWAVGVGIAIRLAGARKLERETGLTITQIVTRDPKAPSSRFSDRRQAA